MIEGGVSGKGEGKVKAEETAKEEEERGGKIGEETEENDESSRQG